MDQQAIIRTTSEYVREKFSGESSGHDWWHMRRVWNNALYIAKQEKADQFIVSLAALLHDIGDHKFHGGDESVGPSLAWKWLRQFDMKADIIQQICDIIAHVSFKGAAQVTPMRTIEGKVVQDADRLDAIGAMGIARVFAYAGFKGHELHIPGKQPELHTTFEQYKNGKNTAINHFYEKLLLLKDRMHTVTGKKMAAERHRFMEQYLARFYQEWEGNA